MTRVRRLSSVLGAMAGTCLLALAGAASASAQDTTIALGGPAFTALSQAGVTVAAGGPATLRRARITLPVQSVAIAGGRATVAQGGTVRLSAGRRSVELSQLRVTVGKRSTLSASIDGTRRTVATIAASSNRRSVDASGTYITESPLSLTAATVALLRTELRAPGLSRGRLGVIDLQASVSATAPPTDIPGAPSAPTVTGPPTPGGATPSTRPDGAVPITGGTVTWAPRASWLGYLQSSGPGSGAVGADGATFNGTAFTLPISGGWYDAASQTAFVGTEGTTRFVLSGHSIDMAFTGWTYDLAGAAPKAVATVTAASGATSGVGTRQPLALIKRGAIAPVVGADGRSVTWTAVPLTLSAEGVALYRAYLYDSDQGSITIAAALG